MCGRLNVTDNPLLIELLEQLGIHLYPAASTQTEEAPAQLALDLPIRTGRFIRATIWSRWSCNKVASAGCRTPFGGCCLNPQSKVLNQAHTPVLTPDRTNSMYVAARVFRRIANNVALFQPAVWRNGNSAGYQSLHRFHRTTRLGICRSLPHLAE